MGSATESAEDKRSPCKDSKRGLLMQVKSGRARKTRVLGYVRDLKAMVRFLWVFSVIMMPAIDQFKYLNSF